MTCKDTAQPGAGDSRGTAVTSDIQHLVEQYIAVWNETGQDARRRRIDEVFAADAATPTGGRRDRARLGDIFGRRRMFTVGLALKRPDAGLLLGRHLPRGRVPGPCGCRWGVRRG